MMTLLTTTIARVLYGLPMVIFGLMHFMNAKGMAGMVPKWVPGGGIFWIYVIGIALIAAGVAIIVNKKGRLASLCLAALLATFVITLHMPGLFSTNALQIQMAMVGMLKDSALAGGALTLAGILSD